MVGRLPADCVLLEIREVWQAKKHQIFQVFPTSSQGWSWFVPRSDVGSLSVREACIDNGASGGSGLYDLNSCFVVRGVKALPRALIWPGGPHSGRW
jgi:hypothetical protein